MEIEEPPPENAFIPTIPDIASAPPTKKKQAKRMKYDYALLETFCKDNAITLLEDYSNRPINRDLIINGKCRNQDCRGTFRLEFRNLYVKSSGYCKPCMLKESAVRGKKTFLEKYGVDSPSKCPEIIEKFKKTCLVKYGYENPGQNSDVKKKIKETFEIKYGGHPLKTKEIREKGKQTCIVKYGCENPGQNEEIKQKNYRNI
jgi:hypothetical protein